MVLQLSTTDKGLYNINVFDVAGQLRMSRQIAVNAGITRKDFSLSAGVYVLEVRSSDGDVITDKVIIR
jgi:hypothetical protein